MEEKSGDLFMKYRAGLDAGSTTVKLVILDESGRLVFSSYRRHFSDLKTTVDTVLEEAKTGLGPLDMSIAVTGSGGMGISERLGLPFVQELIACTKAVESRIPLTDTAIELGGEDSKITFFRDNLEQRMNNSCAGGTGAFIDQMASLLNTSTEGLNRLAADGKRIYPIASRCGVFAKSDIQPLINQGAERADLAKSILQAVANQTITALSGGRKIKGRVAFLGGPLYFMDELRRRFIETLGLKPEDVIFPENALLFTALGAAAHSADFPVLGLDLLLDRLRTDGTDLNAPTGILEPLFADGEELERFRKRHAAARAPERDPGSHRGPAFLGIDAGSTTTKAVLVDGEGNILYSRYVNNEGRLLEKAVQILEELYRSLREDAFIGNALVCGYGETLLKDALRIDAGEVETLCHFKGACHFLPDVDFILDIGGQDMKAIKIEEGRITSILLNEACSSGCGSFIETFSRSLHYKTPAAFAEEALLAKNPSDLGHKCTVFMNSRVKQAQKEGASAGDISAGLAYSVIKNSLYKVIKLRRPEDLGKKILCQGGTFLTDAVLRSFEKISGREAVRPVISGLMGAYGAALLAAEKYQAGKRSSILTSLELKEPVFKKETRRCNLCENHCILTVTLFEDGRKAVTGNRCERGAGRASGRKNAVNLVEYKYKRLFDYPALKKEEAFRGTIGIPRVLNIYENYPFWHSFLTRLGFRVELSPRSSREIYEKGMYTIPGDSVCYPAKLAHGHVEYLLGQNIPVIFFPSVVFESPEYRGAVNHYNCPVIQGYPVLLKNNIEALRSDRVRYLTPVLDMSDRDAMAKELAGCFSGMGIGEGEIREALIKGYEEQERFKQDIRRKGEELLARLEKTGEKGIVLAGSPYHIDPEINHGTAAIIADEGFHVATEDSIAQLGDIENLRVNNVWVYQSRIFAAAKVCAASRNLEWVQLNSFGCGIDSIATDQAEEILRQYGKLSTVIKIDELSNPGTIRIRIRSLKAAAQNRTRTGGISAAGRTGKRAIFTGAMAKTHTIIIPAMTPIREQGLLDTALASAGYRAEYLSFNLDSVELGLQYVNNDFCHSMFDYAGQLITVLRSGKYDPGRVSVMMMESCSLSCRGCNYIPVLRKALDDAGFPQVPIVSYKLWFKDITDELEKETDSGLRLTMPLLRRILLANSYGELFERVVCRTRPYETIRGMVDALHAAWVDRVKPSILSGSLEEFNVNMKAIIRDFDTIPLQNIEKMRIGLVGDSELPFNFSLNGSNNICRLLEAEGAEVVMGNFAYLGTSNYRELGETELAEEYYRLVDEAMNRELENSKRFMGLCSILDMKKEALNIAPFAYYKGNFLFGMGGRIQSLLKLGVNTIVNFISFNCTLNYVVGSGYHRVFKRLYPEANIADIEYFPGIPAVNQINRIRLLMMRGKKAAAF
jgi:predicted CoA-substrate-specific enzyme activase